MLDRLIKKYKESEVSELVFRLSYGGSFIIVKARYLSNALHLINEDLKAYFANPDRERGSMYKPFCEWVGECKKAEARSRFTIRILAKAGKDTSHFELLKTEERELLKNRRNPACLNENKYAHIPVWKPDLKKFGWLDREAVVKFGKWTNSKTFKKLEETYNGKAENRENAVG